jgi:hypothetical protein
MKVDRGALSLRDGPSAATDVVVEPSPKRETAPTSAIVVFLITLLF